MNNSKVYIIIVTYNAMKWIGKCLSSIKSSNIKAEVVVVDNCSKDETLSYIKEKFSSAHIIENKDNRGFGQANNQGIEWAYKHGATHFFLLNQDAYIHKDTIEKLVAIQDKYNIALVSPIHLNGPGDNIDFGFYHMAMADVWSNHFLSDVALGTLKEYYIVDRINAAAWMLSRKTVECIGGFNPLFFHYGEDINYLHRILYHRKQLAFVPTAFINHDRERVGNKKMFEKRAIISYILNAYANINMPMIIPRWNRIKMHLYIIKQAFVGLLHCRFKQFFRFIASYLNLIISIPKILFSRKQDKRMGAVWLNL